MKQYLDKDQTAKLIELGFPKPTRTIIVDGFPTTDMLSRYASYKDDFGFVVCYEGYSIGELIEFLPTSFSKKDKYFHLDIFPARSCWFILYATYNKEEYHRNFKRELIDALFCACVTLKEEGVI